MEFRLSRYAREQMERRGITEQHVALVVDGPSQIVAGHSGKRLHQSVVDFADGRRMLLRVVVATGSDPPTIVTAYRTSHIERYGGSDEDHL